MIDRSIDRSIVIDRSIDRSIDAIDVDHRSCRSRPSIGSMVLIDQTKVWPTITTPTTRHAKNYHKASSKITDTMHYQLFEHRGHRDRSGAPIGLAIDPTLGRSGRVWDRPNLGSVGSIGPKVALKVGSHFDRKTGPKFRPSLAVKK